jgi:hypothetical protein
MLKPKYNPVELDHIAEAVKRVLICRHSIHAGDIAKRVYEKFVAEEKVHNEKLCVKRKVKNDSY